MTQTFADPEDLEPTSLSASHRRGGWLTTKEAAAELGVHPSRVRQLYMEGRLPATKKGRDLYVRYRDLKLVRDRKPGRPRGPAWRGRNQRWKVPRSTPGLEPRLPSAAAAD